MENEKNIQNEGGSTDEKISWIEVIDAMVSKIEDLQKSIIDMDKVIENNRKHLNAQEPVVIDNKQRIEQLNENQKKIMDTMIAIARLTGCEAQLPGYSNWKDK